MPELLATPSNLPSNKAIYVGKERAKIYIWTINYYIWIIYSTKLLFDYLLDSYIILLRGRTTHHKFL